jgi:hypothetical protein
MDVQLRADDLMRCLLVLEREVRSSDLCRRMAAVQDLERVEQLVESFRREFPVLGQSASLFAPLDRKVSSIRRSEAYKAAAWIDTAHLKWYVLQTMVDPVQQVLLC